MAAIRCFKAFRPRPDICDRVAALPYDVYSRKEACEEVRQEPMSFLKVDRAETSLMTVWIPMHRKCIRRQEIFCMR